MKKLIAIFAFLSLATGAFSQAPDGINYQAVIRDNAGAVLTNSPVGMQIAIRQTTATGTVVYEESFAPTTSAYGLVNIVVGQGTVIFGDFTTIDWASGPYFVEVSADETGGTNYSLLGTQQLMSVAYALHANTAENVTNDQVDDADADPTNELQDISLSGTDLSITSGSTVDLSTVQDGTGTDDQNISGSGLAGTNLTIGIEGGASETVDLSSLQDGTGTDDQNISGSGLAGTNLTIGIEGGASETVDLSTLQDGTGTDDQNISGSGLTGTNLTIGIEGGASQVVDLSSLQDGVNDADADPTNELQDISLSGTDLSISNGSTVDLSSLQDGTGTDDQNISGSGLAGTNLTIGIEGGASQVVDLSSLQAGSGGFTHYIGEQYGGGVVFYVYRDSLGIEHGLIANKDESTAVWQASGTTTNAIRSWDGAYNTSLMTSSAAATYVTGLTDGGFTDWYLPSIDELSLLWHNRFIVNKALFDGGFTILSNAVGSNYWSSTEHNSTRAQNFIFIYGYVWYNFKTDTRLVRAVRAF